MTQTTLNWRIKQPTTEEIKEAERKSRYRTDERKCIYCGCEFSFGQKKQKACGLCKLLVKCQSCGEEKEYSWDMFNGKKAKRIKENVLNKENIDLTCGGSCANKVRKSHGTCPNCGHKDVKIYNSRCPYCANKELNAKRYGHKI